MWGVRTLLPSRSGILSSHPDTTSVPGREAIEVVAAAGAPGRAPIQARRELAVGGGQLVGPAAPAAVAEPGGDAGRPLPSPVRGKMEAMFGADFSAVRVHEDTQAAALGAQAFARGEHLHFQPGRFDPDSAAGHDLIGHELAHVVQQRAGRVATPMGKGGINADPALEAEADQMGARAARGETIGGATAALGAAAADGPAQLRRVLSAELVAALLPGAREGWRYVSGGDPHITIFIDADSVQRLRAELEARRIRRNGDNHLDMTTVPPTFRLYYDELHVTSAGTHYYYDDQGMPLAANALGAVSPAFDDPSWATANREIARFLGLDRYLLNQRVNQLGGELPDSAETEQRAVQERAEAQRQRLEAQQQRVEAQQQLRDRPGNGLMQNHLAALRARNAGRGRGGGGLAPQGRGGGGVAPQGRGVVATPTTSAEKRKRDVDLKQPARTVENTEDVVDETEDAVEQALPDEHDDEGKKKQRRPDGDRDGDNGSGPGSGNALTVV